MKRLVTLLYLLCFFLIVLVSGCNTLSENKGANTPSDKKVEARAKAYVGVIEELVNRYGEGAIEPNSFDGENYMTGVSIVRLIDFDGDGDCELYCAYQDNAGRYVNKQIVYGYDEDRLVVLLDESRVSNPGTDISPSVTFLTKNGIVYLVDVYEVADGNYYTLRNGEMVSALRYYLAWVEEEQSTLNDIVATREEVETAIEEMERGGVLESISYAYDVDYEEITKTHDVVANINALIQPTPNT